MQFHVGDRVFHPVHGVGQIETIEKGNLPGTSSRMYYQVRIEKGTLWVPVDAQQTVGLRLLTPKAELDRLRQILKSRPATLNDNHSQRYLEISGRLNNGALDLACQAVRDLVARGWKRPLSSTDVTALRRARERLHKEWAAAAGVSVSQATDEVDALLAQAEKAYK